jgi:hypothetical protein
MKKNSKLIRIKKLWNDLNNKIDLELEKNPNLDDGQRKDLKRKIVPQISHELQNTFGKALIDSLKYNAIDETDNLLNEINELSARDYIEHISEISRRESNILADINKILKQDLKVFEKELSQTKENNNKLEEFYLLHTNKKGKEWRNELYKIADKIFNEEKKYLNKTTCLKEAFERIPNKEENKKDFDLNFKSIYEKFRKR